MVLTQHRVPDRPGDPDQDPGRGRSGTRCCVKTTQPTRAIAALDAVRSEIAAIARVG
ncbi:hypothetical protein MAHJHV60_46130 [Mycobacterium avium subsp. hominissuis]